MASTVCGGQLFVVASLVCVVASCVASGVWWPVMCDGELFVYIISSMILSVSSSHTSNLTQHWTKIISAGFRGNKCDLPGSS